jgi:hypothetical protein
VQLALDPILLNFGLFLLGVWPLWRIFRRAGLNPWWSLLNILSVPAPLLGQLAVVLVLFHKRWPVLPPAPEPPPRKQRRTA